MTSNTHKGAAAARAAADQDKSELRSALLAERKGYVQRGLTDRAAAVDEQLEAIGGKPPESDPPADDDAGKGDDAGESNDAGKGNPPIGKAGDTKAQAPAPRSSK